MKSLLDVAVLDMHHGMANLGHASVVDRLMRIGQEERKRLGVRTPGIRVVSYDVRLGGAVPSSASRFALVVGTGGPGALDPRENDGVSPYAQGIREDPSWEAPLWRFFDAVRREPSTALLGICHTFGLLARWSGFGEAVARSAGEGQERGCRHESPDGGGPETRVVRGALSRERGGTNPGPRQPALRHPPDGQGGRRGPRARGDPGRRPRRGDHDGRGGAIRRRHTPGSGR